MGLLGTLLTFPVSGPILAARAAITTVVNEAERQLYDESVIREQLDQAERAHRAGSISDDEFAETEEALLERLVDARRWRMAKAQRSGDDR
jgi:hypothetical protein